MNTKRNFISWDRPFLKECAESVLSKASESSTSQLLDLSRFICVFPARRPLRVFTNYLVTMANERGAVVQMPSMVTLGSLPEQLYPVDDTKIVSDRVAMLFWIEALKSFSPSELKELYPDLSSSSSFSRWYSLAEFCSSFLSQCAAGKVDVRELDEDTLTKFSVSEAPRWEVLSKIVLKYESNLAAAELIDKHLSRFDALKNSSISSERDVLLIGTADLNPLVLEMLGNLNVAIESYVFAPETHAEAFDQFGNLLTSAWLDSPVAVDDSELFVGVKPEACLDKVIGELADDSSRFSVDKIAIALGDEKDFDSVSYRLKEFGLPHFSGVGKSLTQNNVFRILQAAHLAVSSDQFYNAVALFRHPQIVQYLQKKLEFSGTANEFFALLISEADSYQEKYLQHRFFVKGAINRKYGTLLEQSLEALSELLSPFRAADSDLFGWFQVLLGFLSNLYREGAELPLESLSCLKAIETFREEVYATGVSTIVTCSGSEFLWLLTKIIGQQKLDERQGANGLMLSGWLELLFSEVEAAYVLSAAEGNMPQTKHDDQILPDSTKSALGIPDNDRRLARDLFLLCALKNSKSKLKFLYSKYNLLGEPCLPSRLLYQCSEDGLAKRVQRLFGEEAEEVSSIVPAQLRDSAYVIRAPEDLGEPLSSISVTSFKDYIRCPYRYFLKHVKKARILDDSYQEMQASDFGSMLHSVLDDFGSSDERTSSSAKEIYKFLDSSLATHWNRMFSQNVFPALPLQKQQMKERLKVFSEWQANWRAEGWEITHSEFNISDFDISLNTSAGAVKITGRIDRIDRNVKTGQIVVADYKTSDTPRTPNQTHRYDGGWIDLQLPLYRELLRRCGISDDARPMYILLPADPGQMTHYLVKWTDEDFSEALEIAEELAGNIVNQKYWPPNDIPFGYDDFSAHCGAGQKFVELEL